MYRDLLGSNRMIHAVKIPVHLKPGHVEVDPLRV